MKTVYASCECANLTEHELLFSFSEGKLKTLEWLVGARVLPSSWSQPRTGEVVSHMELTLLPEYDQQYLTCRYDRYYLPYTSRSNVSTCGPLL